MDVAPAPTVLHSCSTPTEPIACTASGLWLFSRKPVDPEAIATMRRVAAGLGLDVPALKAVQQAGCSYPTRTVDAVDGPRGATLQGGYLDRLEQMFKRLG